MNRALFYDFETTGIPDWKNPSEGPQQPHIVQLGALLVDLSTRRVLSTLDLIIRPDNWTIGKDMIAIHGITNEMAMDLGIPESLAIETLLELSLKADGRVSYNAPFDTRLGRIALKRYLNEESAEQWKAQAAQCAMHMANRHTKLGKMPKLVEAYEHFFGRPMLNAHNALADTRACMDVFFAVRDREDSNVVDAEFVDPGVAA